MAIKAMPNTTKALCKLSSFSSSKWSLHACNFTRRLPDSIILESKKNFFVELFGRIEYIFNLIFFFLTKSISVLNMVLEIVKYPIP